MPDTPPHDPARVGFKLMASLFAVLFLLDLPHA